MNQSLMSITDIEPYVRLHWAAIVAQRLNTTPRNQMLVDSIPYSCVCGLSSVSVKRSFVEVEIS